MKKTLAIGLAVAMFAFAGTVFADVNSSSISITTTNAGSIDNYTSAKAETGGNWAGGSFGGNGGEGGEVEAEDGDFNNGGATAGNGGNGGNADIGGTVTTGDANADAGTLNTLNTTDVDVDLYGENMNSSSLVVDTDNDNCGCDNNIDNHTKARARTGGNDAQGSEGGEGGEGGDVEVDDDGDNNNGGATGGSGGSGGTGAAGGWVVTGVATSNAGSVNVLNATLVRVRL